MSAACVHQGFSEKEAEWVQILFRVWTAKLFCLETAFLQFALHWCKKEKKKKQYSDIYCLLKGKFSCATTKLLLLLPSSLSAFLHASIQLSVDQSADNYFSRPETQHKIPNFNPIQLLLHFTSHLPSGGTTGGTVEQSCSGLCQVPWNMAAGNVGCFMPMSIIEVYAALWVPVYRDKSLLDTISTT